MSTFPLTLRWTGNTLDPAYSRDAEISLLDHAPIPASSAPTHAGDPTRWNPEQLLGSALATCHLLTFLALASKTGLQVLAYEDHVESTLETVERIARVGEIRLQPVIRVAAGTPAGKGEELFQKAHKYCIVANSIACRVRMEPRIIEG
jgi:organic hydroperoxide reductase OsmC/OhrA